MGLSLLSVGEGGTLSPRMAGVLGSSLLGPIQAQLGRRESKSQSGEPGEGHMGASEDGEEIHKTHKKQLMVRQRGIYWGLLKNTGIIGVWNHLSEAIQGGAVCSQVTESRSAGALLLFLVSVSSSRPLTDPLISSAIRESGRHRIHPERGGLCRPLVEGVLHVGKGWGALSKGCLGKRRAQGQGGTEGSGPQEDKEHQTTSQQLIFLHQQQSPIPCSNTQAQYLHLACADSGIMVSAWWALRKQEEARGARWPLNSGVPFLTFFPGATLGALLGVDLRELGHPKNTGSWGQREDPEKQPPSYSKDKRQDPTPLRVLEESLVTWMDCDKDEQQNPGHVRGPVRSGWRKNDPLLVTRPWDIGHQMHASLRKEDVADSGIWVARKCGQHVGRFEGEDQEVVPPPSEVQEDQPLTQNKPPGAFLGPELNYFPSPWLNRTLSGSCIYIAVIRFHLDCVDLGGLAERDQRKGALEPRTSTCNIKGLNREVSPTAAGFRVPASLILGENRGHLSRGCGTEVPWQGKGCPLVVTEHGAA
ncbi:hypothetical protein Cadr_000022098 [Camelus dromedarius]|uniref:Uncharacterized protein n=1 Tax=Camelus dromedarius TaxID=9838 RepID=A0A5N4CR34_CAMDR|nr:hypothetical protein Cadr_000022098 [Camelus dromedarius]